MRKTSEVVWGALTLAVVSAYVTWCLHTLLWTHRSTGRIGAAAILAASAGWVFVGARWNLRLPRREPARSDAPDVSVRGRAAEDRAKIKTSSVPVALVALTMTGALKGAFITLVASLLITLVIVVWLADDERAAAANIAIGFLVVAMSLLASGLPVWGVPTQGVVAIVTAIPVAMLVAWQWSRRSMRVLMAGVVVFGLLVTVKVGRVSAVDAGDGSTRLDALALDAQRATAHTAAAEGWTAAHGKIVGVVGRMPADGTNCPDGLETADASCLAAAVRAVSTAATGLEPFVGLSDAQSKTVDEGRTRLSAVNARLAVLAGEEADLEESQPEEANDDAQAIAASGRDAVGVASAAVGGAFDALQLTIDLAKPEATARTTVDQLCTSARGRMEEIAPNGQPPTGTAARACRSDGIHLQAATAFVDCGVGDEEAMHLQADRLRIRAVAAVVAERDVAAMLLVAAPGDEPSQTRSKTAVAEVDLACARLQLPDPTTSLVDLLQDGGNRMARVIPGVSTGQLPIGLSVAGWLVVALLAIAFYRHLEISNNRRGLGLVSFAAFDAAPNTKKDEYAALFKRHVLANVAEPGSIPGALSTQGLTDLIDLGSDVGSKFVAKVIGVIKALTAPVPGYDVTGFYQAITAPAATTAAAGAPVSATPTEPAVTAHEVFVRISHLRAATPSKTMVVRAASAELAIRQAGYRVAAYVLQADKTSPDWTSWGLEAADALAEYDESAFLTGQDRIEKLTSAARDNPNSGLVLAVLANELALKGDHMSVLDLHLRAVTRHPRYPVVRYRLPISLSNVAAGAAGAWRDATIAERQRACFEIKRAAAACSMNVDVPIGVLLRDCQLDQPGVAVVPAGTVEPTKDEVAAALLKIAASAATSAQLLFGWSRMANNSLRREERRLWLPMIVRARGRVDARRWRRMTDLVKECVAARQGVAMAPSPRADDGAQAVYNIACINAIVGTVQSRRDAMRYLEEMLERDGAGRINRPWVEADPDLHSIRNEQRFTTILDELSRRDVER
jgi:hypothetical protein